MCILYAYSYAYIYADKRRTNIPCIYAVLYAAVYDAYMQLRICRLYMRMLYAILYAWVYGDNRSTNMLV